MSRAVGRRRRPVWGPVRPQRRARRAPVRCRSGRPRSPTCRGPRCRKPAVVRRADRAGRRVRWWRSPAQGRGRWSGEVSGRWFFDQEDLNTGDLVDTLPVTARADLTDAQWAVLEPLLPKGT